MIDFKKSSQHSINRGVWDCTNIAIREAYNEFEQNEEEQGLEYFYGQLRLTIKLFRKIESRIMFNNEPSEKDILYHKATTSLLISFVALLIQECTSHENEDFKKYADIKVLKALLQDLENSYQEWHGQVYPEHLEQLKKQIFDASPGFNF